MMTMTNEIVPGVYHDDEIMKLYNEGKDGRTLTYAEIGKELGLSKHCVNHRICSMHRWGELQYRREAKHIKGRFKKP